MELAKYKACICEGAAENAVMDILLDADLLVFSREEMLEEAVIRCREGNKFEQKYLRKGFADKISVIRILDSRREKFKIATVYKGNIIKNLIMDCQSYTKYRPNETTGGIFVSWRRKEELPTGA